MRAGPPAAIACLVAVVAACGRLRYDAGEDAGEDAGRADAALDAGLVDAARDTGVDARPDGDRPDAGRTPFAPPERVEELFDPGNATADPTLSADRTELFFVRRPTPADQADVYVAVRSDAAGPFGPPVMVTALNSGSDETGLHLSRDGLTMWLASMRGGGLGFHDIWLHTRPGPDGPWGMPVHVGELSSAEEDGTVTVDASGTSLVMAARASDLYMSRRATPADPWIPPVPIDELNTPGMEGAGALSPDGLTFYFMSDRPGTLGARDLFVTSRPALDAPFGAPEPLTELNSPADESSPWISADGREIWFETTRDGQSALYRAFR